MFADNHDTTYFEIDRVTGHVTIREYIPADELLQPTTFVLKVNKVIQEK